MRKSMWLTFFLLSASLVFALTYSSTPPEISQIVPSSAPDFPYSSNDSCIFSETWGEYSKVYEFHRYLSKYPPRKKVGGDEIPFPAIWLSVFYSPNITPLPKSKIEEKMRGVLAVYKEKEKEQSGKIVIKNVRKIEINNYPVSEVYYNEVKSLNSILTESQKGNFYLKATVHFDIKEDPSNYYKHGEAAIEYMLSRIPDVPEIGATPSPESGTVRAKPGIATPKEPTMLEKWQAEQKKELAERLKQIDEKAKALEYRYSDAYQKDQAERLERQSQKAESERQKTATRYEAEDVFARALEESKPTQTVKTNRLVCDGLTFTYYPDELLKHAKSGETYEVGKWWENKTFAGPEDYRRPLIYAGKYYIPVAYLKNNEITGYLWLNEQGEILKDATAIRALFTYLNVFGFAAQTNMKREAERFDHDALKCEEEIQSYTYYKDAAKTLKLASNAMSIYLSGGLKGISSTLSVMDAALFMKKIEMLEAAGKTSPDFETFEDLAGQAQNLDSLNDIAKATTAAYQMQKLQSELQTLKDMDKISKNKAAMDAAQTSILGAAASLGWTVFDKAESTGQVAEQSAVIAINYEELRSIDLLISQVIKDALDGIGSEQEAKNIFLLPKMKAKAYKIKGDLAFKLLESYRERKTSISGYLGRFILYIEGKSVSEDQAEETIRNLQDLVDMELERYYKVKVETDVGSSLSTQRATL